MRVKRGTLEAEREGGRLYVLLDSVPTTDPTDRTDELITELRDRVRSLESQLDHERDANRENRRIIAALTSRIPAIEAPQEPSESPEPAESPGGPRESPSPTRKGHRRPHSPGPAPLGGIGSSGDSPGPVPPNSARMYQAPVVGTLCTESRMRGGWSD